MKQKGFTLIELLLAMTLLALLMSLAYSGMRAGTRAASKGTAVIDEINGLRVTQQFLRQQWSRILPLIIETDDDENPVIFEGDSHKVRFVSAMPGYLGHGGPQVQTLEITKGELLFWHHSLNLFNEPDGQEEPIVLIDGIQSGEFSYTGLDEEGELADWDNEWEDSGLTPIMIKLDITFKKGRRIQWPELVVVPQLDASSARQSVRTSLIPRS
ncbi:MAG: prepilin-type N-terminal cleavage/methylation domain-containing protein [bacterium]